MGRSTISIIALVTGLCLGVITAINALGAVGLKSVAGSPKWSEWQLESNSSTLIYVLGHFLGDGRLPPPKSARYFVRSTDEDGNGLRADCVYDVQGKVTPARWWTLSINQDGTAKPHSELTAGEAVVGQDEVLHVFLSAHPMPGNWMVPPDNNAMTLNYIINEPTQGETISLPSITKSGC